MSELQSTIEFLQTEVTMLRELLEKVAPYMRREICRWQDIEDEHASSLRGQPPDVLEIMKLVDTYSDLRSGPFPMTQFDYQRRDEVIHALRVALGHLEPSLRLALDAERKRCAAICENYSGKHLLMCREFPEKAYWAGERSVGAADCATLISKLL